VFWFYKRADFFFRSCFSIVLFGKLGELWAILGEIWAKMMLEVPLLVKIHPMKFSRLFLEVFFSGAFSGKFGVIWAKIYLLLHLCTCY